MIDIVNATFKDGVFQPDRQPELSENARVRLVIESVADQPDEQLQQQAWASLEQLWRDSVFDSHGNRLSRDELHERR